MLCFNSSLSLTLWSCYTRIERAEQAHLSVMAPCPFHSPICGADPLMTWGCQKVYIGRSAVTGVWLQKELRLYFMNELSLFSVDFYRFHSWALMSHNHCFDFVKPEGRCILFVDPPGYKWRGGGDLSLGLSWKSVMPILGPALLSWTGLFLGASGSCPFCRREREVFPSFILCS